MSMTFLLSFLLRSFFVPSSFLISRIFRLAFSCSIIWANDLMFRLFCPPGTPFPVHTGGLAIWPGLLLFLMGGVRATGGPGPPPLPVSVDIFIWNPRARQICLFALFRCCARLPGKVIIIIIIFLFFLWSNLGIWLIYIGQFAYTTRGGIRKRILPLLILTFPLLSFSLLHALLFTHFGAPRKLILGMPPYFDPTRRNL